MTPKEMVSAARLLIDMLDSDFQYERKDLCLILEIAVGILLGRHARENADRDLNTGIGFSMDIIRSAADNEFHETWEELLNSAEAEEWK